MSFKKIGWFTSARDEAALKLFKIVLKEVESGFLPVKPAYVFLSTQPEESRWAKKVEEEAVKRGVRVISLSAKAFLPKERKENREKWRIKYHQAILELLPEEVDFGVLAGYMWITSEEFCRRLFLINLHPALPGGPKGTWQEVIWQLISARAAETGVMMHRVTPELDEGPPISFVRFSIRTKPFIPLWEEAEKFLLKGHLSGLKKGLGESCGLFRKIREEGVKRELPLIVYTIKMLAETKNYKDFPLDLSQKIENYLKTEKFQ
jgi:phosphoribosylglycinamide formyltransferase-1